MRVQKYDFFSIQQRKKCIFRRNILQRIIIQTIKLDTFLRVRLNYPLQNGVKRHMI